MSVYPNQIALSADVADRLRSANEVPLSYLNGMRFTNSSNLKYFTSENAKDIFTKRYYNNPSNDEISKYDFGSLAINQSNFQFVDLSKDTPKHFVDLIDSGANRVSYPIASYDDLSTIVVNAFLPLTNIRKSSFLVLEKQGSDIVVKTYNGNALLTDNAITANNGKKLEVNLNEDSKIVIDSSQKFLENISEEIATKIDNLRPQVDSSNKFSGCLSANLLSLVVNVALEGVNYIREHLTCYFAEFDPNKQIRVIYHEKNNGTGRTVSSDVIVPYSNYTVSGYNALFGAPTDGSEFRAWTTSKNGSTPSYYQGSVLHVTESSVELYPIFTPIYTITYKYNTADNTDTNIFSNQSDINAGKIYDKALQNSTYKIKALSADHTSNEKFVFASGKKSTFNPFFNGYATDANSSVKYAFANSKFSPASFTVTKNVTLWVKFRDRVLEIGTKELTSWSSKRYSKGTWTTTPVAYPLVIRKTKYGDLESIMTSKKIGFVFTGWVNEKSHRHTTNIYLEKVVDNKGNKLLGKNFLFAYGQEGGYNAWSVHISQDEPYEKWPRTKIFWANLPTNVSDRSTTLSFYFVIEDSMQERKDKETASSNGVVGVSEIHFK